MFEQKKEKGKMKIPYLKDYYLKTIKEKLKEQFSYKNDHMIPMIQKITLNSAVKAEIEMSVFNSIQQSLGGIVGQKVTYRRAKKSISNFKLRKNVPIAAFVTLRGNIMWNFLYKLINISLPKIRDFRGLSKKLDGAGNYSLGIKDISIFPEINLDSKQDSFGFDITIVTSAKSDKEGYELLKLLGMPFRKN